MNVLVLNKNYQPVKTESWQRAAVMLAREVAEVVDVEYYEKKKTFTSYNFEDWYEVSQLKKEFQEEEYDFIECVDGVFAVPQIIRLLTYDNNKKKKIRFSRKNIYLRDQYTCQYCGKQFGQKRSQELSLDHVIPRAQGGKSTWENLVLSCVDCNTAKGNRTPAQAGLKLLSKPKKPSEIYDIPRHKRYKSWESFISDSYWNVELNE